MPSPTSSSDVALAAHGVTQRYRRGGRAVLDGCTLTVPAGAVSALVGPNGAGKSTLLELVAGMRRPGSGAVEVFGASPRAGHPLVAYLAQHRPLFPRFTVAETLRFGARMNGDGWDAELADRLLGSLRDRLDDRVGELSGGERTRVSLALVLGKRAELLLLDEPLADLDVLARQDVMGLLMAHVADTGTTVVMSAHIISELADVCDHLLLLQEGTTRLCGGIDELTASHAVVTLPGGSDRLAGHTVVESRPAGRGTSALVRPAGPLPAEWDVRPPSLDELVLSHLTSAGAPGPALAPIRPSKENAA